VKKKLNINRNKTTKYGEHKYREHGTKHYGKKKQN
jgi:hypothetical protein